MDDPPSPRGSLPPITTSEDLQEVLTAAVTEAVANGLEVQGSWLVSRDDGTRTWGIEINEMVRRSTDHARDMEHTISMITETVTSREGVETTDLPPLHDVIDPEIIDLLYGLDETGGDRYVTFQYCGYWITVRSDGVIVIDG